MAQQRKVRVLVADAEAVSRYGLLRLLETDARLMTCGEAENLGQARDMAARHKPDVLIFDPVMGDGTAFLKELGAGYVYGVDHDQNMIDLALATKLDGTEFLFIAGTIPLPDESVDGAVSLTVFVEIRTIDAMRRTCSEVARVLRRGSVFVVMSISPMAFGHTFRNFGYPATERLHSGAITSAIVTAPGGQFSIDDTYWTEDDYRGALSQAGFTVAAIDYPRPRDPSAWATDEAAVPPFIVIKAIK